MRRRYAVLGTACAAVAFGAVVGSAGAGGEDVTIAFQRYFDAACNCYKLRFFGTISSNAANEYVAVLQQKCGVPYSTAVAGASTRAGGGWETDAYAGFVSATYRARWNDQLSPAAAFRPPISASIKKLGGGGFRVSVYTYQPEGRSQNMTGKVVVLQRLVGGRWTRVRSTTLNKRFSADFTVTVKGLTLRVLVPAKSAAPCYAAGATKTFRS